MIEAERLEKTKLEDTIALVENKKINKSNAFDHQILDELIQVISKDQCFEEETWSKWNKYSSGIFSAGRVYSYCVENIHDETVKLLSGLEVESAPVKIESKEERPSKTYKSRTLMTVEQLYDPKNEFTETYEFQYFRQKAYQVNLGKLSLGLLNILEIDSKLDFCTGETKLDCMPVWNCITNNKINLESLINFSLVDIENLKIFNENNSAKGNNETEIPNFMILGGTSSSDSEELEATPEMKHENQLTLEKKT